MANDQSLPVDLISFEGQTTKSGIRLKWETASEFNNLGFQILKRDINHNFVVLANYKNDSSLKSKGNGAFGFHYAYEDTSVSPGHQYQYVLQSISFSGHTVSHDTLTIIMVKLDSPVLIRSYPNPFNSRTEIFIKLNAEINVPPQIEIFDLNGRRVKSFKRTIPSSTFRLKWDGRDGFAKILPSGIYFLRIKSEQFEHTMKLLLIR